MLVLYQLAAPCKADGGEVHKGSCLAHTHQQRHNHQLHTMCRTNMHQYLLFYCWI